MFFADMSYQLLGEGRFWRAPLGALGRFVDLLFDPTLDSFLFGHSAGT